MTSRKKRNDTLSALIKNGKFDDLKSNVEMIFARKITNKIQKREEEIISKLKSNIKGSK